MCAVFLADSIADRLLLDFADCQTLPSERKLSEYYNCNRLTVRRAIKILNDKGLVSSSRRGHAITEAAVQTQIQTPPAAGQPTVMVISMERSLLDHSHTYLLGGMFHQARELGLKVVFRELSESLISGFQSHREIDDGQEIAGYIVASQAPMKLHDLLSNSMKPCVINGNFLGQDDQPERVRFMQVRIDYNLIFRDIGSRLLRQGHRKILLAHTNAGFMLSRVREGLEQALRESGCEGVDFTTSVYPVDIFQPGENIRQVARTLAADAEKYTALILPCGNIFGLEAVQALRERRLRLPEDLSLVMLGYETDYFLNVFDISTVYADVRELGGFCVKSLQRQLQNGRLEFGVNYFSVSFIERATIASPKHSS